MFIEKSQRQRNYETIVNSAIAKFNAQQQYLLRNDLSERCICSKFAIYLEREIEFDTALNAYSVDVEYNRGADGKEGNPKVIDNHKIVVDLIVHKRGYDQYIGFDNQICIEMKKSTDKRGLTADKERLTTMTDYQKGFGYKIGFMIVANMVSHELVINETFYKQYG